MKLLGLLFCVFPVIFGKTADIRGYNFYGIETPRRDFVCTWQNPVSYYIDKLAELDFNFIRVPFSLQYVEANDFSKMDGFFDAVKKHPQVSIVLDLHRVYESHQGATPFEGGVSLTRFTDAWKKILNRYKDFSQLVAVDIFNEYQGTDAIYWNSVAQQITDKIEDEFPNRFTYYVGGWIWGGNLHGISLEDLPYANRINYTIHKYVFSNGDENEWNYSFGDHKNKMNVGEWGFKTELQNEVNWAKRFIAYLKKIDVRNSFFWTIALSGDTNGIWHDSCQEIDWYKYDIIKSLWYDEPPQRNLRALI
jgi:hypothetical protein